MIHPQLHGLRADEKAQIRIVVAMSGGVDSSVAAALLKEQGFQVIGLALKTYDLPKGEVSRERSCCSLDDMEDARRVCERIKIPFYVINTQEEFRAKVIDPFIHGYIQGRTPNPCVTCNTFIKFDFLMQKAAELNADFVATGHYALLDYSEDGNSVRLLRARDEEKDQSYFLYSLSQAQLRKTLFPVGIMTKEEVRKLAESLRLPVAKKADSQEICFVNDNAYGKFIEDNVAPSLRQSGKIVFGTRVLGKHEGIHNFTIGQRRGLKLEQKTKEPLYVSSIDPETQTVEVNYEVGLMKNALLADRMNWIRDPHLVHDRDFKVKVRSAAKPVKARISLIADNQAIVRFNEPQRAPTPGQSIVVYEDEEVVGGGVIDRTYLWKADSDDFSIGVR